MPTVEQNLKAWSQTYSWDQRGEEWSRTWGGSEAQWYFVIYPRVHLFLPVRSILEIAPGYGRWTKYLKDYCDELIGVDLSPTCVDACNQRFMSAPHASFHVNDGYSLSMIPDDSVDFLFTFDSLVHAENDVIIGYLSQLARILHPHGIAFIHHSNMGAHCDVETDSLREGVENPHWRATTVSAKSVAGDCLSVGLQCVSQEIVNWGVSHLTDCFSTVTRIGSQWARDNMVIQNPDFMKEAIHVAKISELYVRRSATVAGLPEE